MEIEVVKFEGRMFVNIYVPGRRILN